MKRVRFVTGGSRTRGSRGRPGPGRAVGATGLVLFGVLVLVPMAGSLASPGSPATPVASTTPEPTRTPSASPTTTPLSTPAHGPTPTHTPTPSVVEASAEPSTSGTALEALALLAVKGRAPKTGYAREEFGQAWADVDRNGCDTRNDVLRRDLTDTTLKQGTHGCLVLSGTLADPYSATSIAFLRGEATSTAVQIDHVVALSDAWQKGAQALTLERRTALANDPLNLLAVDGPLNAQKGAGDAATWLPPSKAFRCQYVARQVAVKLSYDLWVTSAEHDAIERILTACPGEPLPAAGAPEVTATATPTPTPAPEPEPEPEPAPAPEPAPSTTAPAAPVYYANCTAARAAGAAPLYVGEPGYRAKMDGDKDGIACE